MANQRLQIQPDSYLAGVISFGMLSRVNASLYVLSGVIDPDNAETLDEVDRLHIPKYSDRAGRVYICEKYSDVDGVWGWLFASITPSGAPSDYVRGVIDQYGKVTRGGLSIYTPGFEDAIVRLFRQLPFSFSSDDGAVRFDGENAARLIAWCGCRRHTISGGLLSFRFKRTDPAAAPPAKSGDPRDSGYDLKLVRLLKTENGVYYYDTCVQLQPPDGYYFDMIGRSRIAKTGWMLANAVGVLDNTYRGSVVVALTRFRADAPELDLEKIGPLVQIIPRRIRHFTPVEVDTLDETSRGATGGLGSAQFAVNGSTA